MKGMTFVHIGRDPRAEGRINIKSGLVKNAVGANHWLLEFNGRQFKFAQVLPTDALAEGFSFFGSEAEGKAFIAAFVAENAPPLPPPEVAPAEPTQDMTPET